MLRRRAEEARQREARREDGTAQGRRGRGKNPSGAKRDWQGSRQWYQPSQRDQPPQGRPSPNEWAEIAPCPNRTSGPSRLTRCTIGIPGIAPVSSFSLRLPRSADIPKFPARWRGASPQRYEPQARVARLLKCPGSPGKWVQHDRARAAPAAGGLLRLALLEDRALPAEHWRTDRA